MQLVGERERELLMYVLEYEMYVYVFECANAGFSYIYF